MSGEDFNVTFYMEKCQSW